MKDRRRHPRVRSSGMTLTVDLHCGIDPLLSHPFISPCRYADSFENAVLANTNVGGENCHRGSALGALMGAAVGEKGIPRRLIEGLRDTAAIAKEIDDFVDAVVPP